VGDEYLRIFKLVKGITLLFESFISRRYLLSKEHKALVSIITIISILGVTVGVAALITVISVMDGFDATLIKKMTGTYSHIEIRSAFPQGIIDYDKLTDDIEAREGIVAASPMIRRQAFLQKSTGIETQKVGALLMGIDTIRERKVSTVLDKIVRGRMELGYREILLGEELARRLGVDPDAPGNNSIYAITKLAKTANGPWAKINQLKVTGTFKSGLYEVDSNFAYVSMGTMQKIFLLDDMADLIHAKVESPIHVSKYSEPIEEKYSPYFIIRTWKELSPDFFYALKLEKIVMFIILLLIVVVASFNIIGTLIMVTTQKTREIGILKSMGASNKSIKRIFLLHGITIGAFGTGIGVIVGIVLCLILQKIEFELPPAVYGIKTLPVLIKPLTVWLIVASSMFLCVVAAVIPAYQASRMDPVEALRYE
jgi:lipoprotein-releasing system permease protein